MVGTYFCGWLQESQNSQKLEPAKISCTRLSKLCNPNPLHPPTWPLTEKLSMSKHYQEPIRGSQQLPCVRVTVFSRTSLFLVWFWCEFWKSFKFHKPVSKTYRAKNDIFLPFNNLLVFLFDILFFECGHKHSGDSIFAGKSALKCV